jgi:hypothetical protein
LNRVFCLLAVILLLGVSAFAQDPGMQDSVIIGSAYAESSDSLVYVNIPVYLVTDDSVMFYHFAISWASSIGGVYADTGTIYYPPWDCQDSHRDTVYLSGEYIDFIGFGNPGLPCDTFFYTSGVRSHLLDFRFAIEPNAPNQTVVLDSTFDDRNLSLLFGLPDGIQSFVPAFQPGHIYIGFFQNAEGNERMPLAFELGQNYPNPFNPSTIIEFSLMDEHGVALTIFDLLGRKVRSLHEGYLEAGAYSLVWDGKNETGNNVPSGTYFYKLTAGDYSQTRRMALVR